MLTAIPGSIGTAGRSADLLAGGRARERGGPGAPAAADRGPGSQSDPSSAAVHPGRQAGCRPGGAASLTFMRCNSPTKLGVGNDQSRWSARAGRWRSRSHQRCTKRRRGHQQDDEAAGQQHDDCQHGRSKPRAGGFSQPVGRELKGDQRVMMYVSRHRSPSLMIGIVHARWHELLSQNSYRNRVSIRR